MTKSALQQIRGWLHPSFDCPGPWDVPAIIEECTAHLQKDPKFCDAFVVEYLEGIVASVCHGIAYHARGLLFDDAPEPETKTRVIGREELLAVIDEETSAPYAPWLPKLFRNEKPLAIEQLMRMDKLQLAEVEQASLKIGDAAYKDAAFFRALSSMLRTDQIVADAFTERQLEELHQSIQVKIKADVRLAPMLTEGVPA